MAIFLFNFSGENLLTGFVNVQNLKCEIQITRNMYQPPLTDKPTTCDYSSLVPGARGYSYTKSKYFAPDVNCTSRICRNRYTDSNTNYSEPHRPGTVTSKIQAILKHYEADLKKCDAIQPRYNTGDIGCQKTVRFAPDRQNMEGQLEKSCTRRHTELFLENSKERYDHYARNILDVMKLNNYMDETGSSAGSSVQPRTVREVHEYSQTYPSQAEDQQAREREATVGSYTNIGLLKTVLKKVQEEVNDVEKTYKNTSVQCNTSLPKKKCVCNEMEKDTVIENKLDMTEKLKTLFDKMNRKTLSADCKYAICCRSSKSLVHESTAIRRSLSTIVTSRKADSTNKAVSFQNTEPKKDKCNKFIQNSRKMSKKNGRKPKKTCSKKMVLHCDPQCQKLKKKIENIHKGLEEKEPYYSFCGKVRHRGVLSHPLLDRNCRSMAKRPSQLCNRTAIIKTLDSTKISIKANTLVINCTKENYPNILKKIRMMELSETGTEMSGISKGKNIGICS